MTATESAASFEADTLPLEQTPLASELVIDGSPQTGSVELTSLSGLSIGVWEHTPGTSRDVETDEVFVVLSGAATLAFDDGSPAVELRPGSVVRLREGQRTTWTVRETLRKVYIA